MSGFRDPAARVPAGAVRWLRELYLALRTELQQYRHPAGVGG